MHVPKMLTIDGAAKEFDLPKHFIRQVVLDKRVVYVKAGRKYLINAEKFAEWLNSGEQEGDAPGHRPQHVSGSIRCLS